MPGTNNTTGANCAYHPKLSDLTLEQLMELYRQLTIKHKAVGAEVQKRIYKIEKRS